MIAELAKRIDGFPGEACRTRCFCHIVNLVAKSLMKQFNYHPRKKKAKSKKRKRSSDENSEEEYEEEPEVDEQATLEELIMSMNESVPDLVDQDDEEDEVEYGEDATGLCDTETGNDTTFMDGFVDEVAELDDVDKEQLAQDNQPIRLVLAKVNPYY